MQKVWPIAFGLGMLLLLSACKTSGASLMTHPLIPPVLQAQPIPATCNLNGQPAQCVKLLESDYKRLVVGLQAACVASGGTDRECGTIVDPGVTGP